MKIKIAIGIVISAIFLYLTFNRVDFGKIIEILKQADYIWLLPALFFMLLSHWLRAVRWKLIMDPVKRVKIHPLFSALMIGYAANNVFPLRMGEFLRAFAISKSQRISKSSSFATVFVERFILDFIPLLVILAIAFLLFASVLNEQIKLGGYLITAMTLVVIVVLILLVQKTDATINKLNSFLPARLFKMVDSFLPSFVQGCSVFKKSEHYLGIIVLTVIVWFLYIISIYFSFYVFDFPAKYGLDVGAGLVVLVFASFGILIPASPGYVGTFHYFCALSLMALNVPSEEAKGFALISHIINVLPVSIIGILYFWKENLHFSDAVAEKETVEKAAEKTPVPDSVKS